MLRRMILRFSGVLAAAVLVWLLAVPLIVTLWPMAGDLAAVGRVWGELGTWVSLGWTLLISGAVAVAAVAISLPAACWLGRCRPATARWLGLGLLSSRPADCVTAIVLPDGCDGGALLKTLEGTYGVKFAGGQEQLKGKIVRVSTMGYSGLFDVIVALSALEMALKGAGAAVELGAGVKAAQQVFLEA